MPSSHSAYQQPTIYQPIYIQPEEKKDKPPSGAFLYTDFYNLYRITEHTAVALAAPESFVLGTVLGLIKGCANYYNWGAPKRIHQDNEINDFGATIHSKGLVSALYVLSKKFVGAWGLANIDQLMLALPDELLKNDTLSVEETAFYVKHGFVIYKAAKLSEELILRAANWADVPVK